MAPILPGHGEKQDAQEEEGKTQREEVERVDKYDEPEKEGTPKHMYNKHTYKTFRGSDLEVVAGLRLILLCGLP